MENITMEDLNYLTDGEMWILLRKLDFSYFHIEKKEKENLSTGEITIIPKIILRTDRENMKIDIWTGISLLNEKRKESYLRQIEKWIELRRKESEEAIK